MSNYDPRTPIIKATEGEMDEVAGHVFHARGPEQAEKILARATGNEPVGDAEVEGHRGRLTDAEAPVEWPRFETEGEEDDDPEVAGHRGFLAR